MDAITPPSIKERPIIFSAAMVRAILEGRKTQTRRIIKPQPIEASGIKVEHFHPAIIDRLGDLQPGPEIFGAYTDDGEWGVKCPYGQPGDGLWVREAFSGEYYLSKFSPSEWISSLIWYWADGNPHDGDWTKPKPSIHMPRWASRIFLEVVSVRVERLRDISEADAMAEGIQMHRDGDFPIFTTDGKDCWGSTAWSSYRYLWDKINGEGAFWDNPWVWVIEFKRVDAHEQAA